MTKNSYLKHEIRARMERTGESYSAAARAVGKTPGAYPAIGHSFAGGEASFSALIIFTEQLATLLATGLTFKDGLAAAAEHTEDTVLAQALHAVLADKEAADFGSAMANYPTAFRGILPTVVTAMLTSGSGELQGLRAMAALYRTHLEMARESEELDDWDDDFEADFGKPDRVTFGGAKGTGASDPALASRPHAVVIGDHRTAAAVIEAKPAWTFHHFATIESFAKKLGEGDETLTNAVAVLVNASGHGWNALSNDVPDLAEWLAPYCLFGVVSPNPKDFETISWSLRKRRGGAPKIYSIASVGRTAETLSTALGAFLVEAPETASDALEQLR